MKFILKNIFKKGAILLIVVASQLYCSAQFSVDFGASLLVGLPKTLNFEESGGGTSSFPSYVKYYSYKINGGGIGAFAFPKYHFKTIGKHSLSVGAPISLAFSGGKNSQTGASESSFLSDFNISCDLNVGKFNKREDNSRSRTKSKSKSKSGSRTKSSKRWSSSEDAPFGYYVGLGFGRTSSSAIAYELLQTAPSATESGLIKFNGNTSNVYEHMSAKSTGIFLQAGIGKFTFLENISPSLGNLGLRVAFKPGLTNHAMSYATVSLYYAR